MNNKIICAKCNGAGHISHYDEEGVWTEFCSRCGGKGVLKDIVLDNNSITFDDIVEIISNEMVTITRQEYEELLEYKRKYERLCT